MGIQRVPNLLRWTVLACCLPYPGDPKSAIDCFFLFGISLHPGVTGSAPHWRFRGCRVHSFPSPQELLRPASWLALLSRTFTFELAPTRSPSISVEYDYVDKQSIPTAGLSPASPTALWAAGHRNSPRAIFHGQRGELRQRYREGQEDQLGALGLVVNAVVLWNTRYLDAALAQVRAAGVPVKPEDVERLSPLLLDHINVLGRYEFALKESVRQGHLRPLREPDELDDRAA